LQELGDLDTAELSAFGKPAERIESVQSASAIVLNENDSQPWVIDMVSHLLQPQLSRLQSREKYWKQLSETWEVIRRSSPEGADYVAMRNGLGLDWEAIRSLTLELGPKTAIVSMFSTGPTTAAFGMSATSELTVFEEPLDSNAWDDISRRLLREVYHFKSGVSRRETWDRPLYPLMEKLAAHFQGVERVLLVLDSAGQTVPWAVVAHRVGWTAANGLPISVVTLPSLTALRQLRRRAAKGVGALVGGNPNGDLPYADEELKQVGNLLRSSPISGPNATTAEIVSGMRGASIIHLATHARFVKGSPLDSGVVLADRALTAREVMHHPLQADLLALSACESGMTQSLGGEEFAGLAQAFLLAGAQSVLVSLWNVNDRATATLMDAFYRAWMGGSDKATALSQAMVEVRTREGWDHPYYWGAFRLIGEWS
jgi:hypothetical protein